MQDTDFQRMQVKIERLESVYNKLERLIESNSSHIGKLKDSIDTCSTKISAVEYFITQETAKIRATTEDSIKEFSNKIAGNSDTIIKLGRGLEERVGGLGATLIQKQGECVGKVEDSIQGFSERISAGEKSIAEYKNDLNEAQVRFTDKLNSKVQALDIVVNVTHIKYIQNYIKEFKQMYTDNLNRVYAETVSLKKDIAKIQKKQMSIKEDRDKGTDNVYSAVNERLNSFIDDINDKLAVKNGNPKAVLKRIAHLEGVKDAVQHRRGAKEVLEKLHNSELDLLKSEVKGSIDKYALERVNTLNWVLGETDE